jgi:hypothetical protein
MSLLDHISAAELVLMAICKLQLVSTVMLLPELLRVPPPAVVPAGSIFQVIPDQVKDAPFDPVYAEHELVLLVTVRVTGVVAVKLPLVPLTVNVYVPAAVEEVVDTLRVEEPEPPPTEEGLKVTLAPVGTPVAVRLTVPVKPFWGDTETV